MFQRPPTHPALAPWIETLWASMPCSRAAPAFPARWERVLPTGHMHVVLRLGPAPLRLRSPGGPLRALATPALVGGARLSPYERVVAAGEASVGAVLLPGACARLLGVRADELAGAHTELGLLPVPAPGPWLDRLDSAATACARVDLLEVYLRACLDHPRHRRPPVQHGWLPASATALARGADVATLAAQSGLSHRAYTTQFYRACGLKPKQYARLRRLQAVLGAAEGAQARWVDLALDAGFADQSHFSREFQALLGLTPGQWRRALGDASSPPGRVNHVPINGQQGANAVDFVQDRPLAGPYAGTTM